MRAWIGERLRQRKLQPDLLSVRDARELVEIYDRAAKGWLTEEEGLIMMADLAEMNAPPSNTTLMHALQEVSATVDRLEKPLGGLERNMQGAAQRRASSAQQDGPWEDGTDGAGRRSVALWQKWQGALDSSGDFSAVRSRRDRFSARFSNRGEPGGRRRVP